MGHKYGSIIHKCAENCFPGCWKIGCVEGIEKWAKDATLGDT